MMMLMMERRGRKEKSHKPRDTGVNTPGHTHAIPDRPSFIVAWRGVVTIDHLHYDEILTLQMDGEGVLEQTPWLKSQHWPACLLPPTSQ